MLWARDVPCQGIIVGIGREIGHLKIGDRHVRSVEGPPIETKMLFIHVQETTYVPLVLASNIMIATPIMLTLVTMILTTEASDM